MKHGSGTYIASRYRALTLRDTVVLCLETEAHTFSDLFRSILARLQRRHLVPMVIDPAFVETPLLIRRLRHSEAFAYLVHAGDHFPFESFRDPAMRTARVVALVAWNSSVDWPGLYRVLTDFAAGGKLVADTLWEEGHRRVLILGTQTDGRLLKGEWKTRFSPLPAFVRTWEMRGGQWVFQGSREVQGSASGVELPMDEICSMLNTTSPPTAVFGARDVEVWELQRTLCLARPEALERVTFVGFYDTPWSRSGAAPFRTVSLNPSDLAAAAMDIVDRLREGKRPRRRCVWVPPSIVYHPPFPCAPDLAPAPGVEGGSSVCALPSLGPRSGGAGSPGRSGDCMPDGPRRVCPVGGRSSEAS